jgi:hypothetical protein
VTTTEDLDRELERLAGLAKDCNGNAHRKEIVWARIDRLLEERGKLSMEVFYEGSSL